MAKDEGPPIGVQPAPGKQRPKPEAERIAARVARFADAPPVSEGVMPLNPGFFQLERMRAGGLVKKRAKVRKKVVGR